MLEFRPGSATVSRSIYPCRLTLACSHRFVDPFTGRAGTCALEQKTLFAPINGTRCHKDAGWPRAKPLKHGTNGTLKASFSGTAQGKMAIDHCCSLSSLGLPSSGLLHGILAPRRCLASPSSGWRESYQGGRTCAVPIPMERMMVWADSSSSTLVVDHAGPGASDRQLIRSWPLV